MPNSVLTAWRVIFLAPVIHNLFNTVNLYKDFVVVHGYDVPPLILSANTRHSGKRLLDFYLFLSYYSIFLYYLQTLLSCVYRRKTICNSFNK